MTGDNNDKGREEGNADVELGEQLDESADAVISEDAPVREGLSFPELGYVYREGRWVEGDDEPDQPTEQTAQPRRRRSRVAGKRRPPRPGEQIPAPDKAIIERVQPAPERPVFKGTTFRGDDATRQSLARWMLAMLGFLVLTACVGWAVLKKDQQAIQSFLLIMSPIVTLTGTILGFYFSAPRQRDDDK